MKNFRPTQVPTISPNLLNQSTEFNLPPSQVQDPRMKRCLSTEAWTDEKHSMYLKSMEASFVKQLYYSKKVLGWSSPKATFSRSTPTTSTQNFVEGSFSSTPTSRVCGLAEGKQIPPASPHLHSCYHDMFFNDIEMSDQNFADEDVECEKKNVKRLKSLISDTSLHQY